MRGRVRKRSGTSPSSASRWCDPYGQVAAHGVEAALVTTGAAGALLLGAAAAVTGGDPKLLRRLPDTAGMKNEIILQKAHHSCYDNQLTDVGPLLTAELPGGSAGPPFGEEPGSTFTSVILKAPALA